MAIEIENLILKNGMKIEDMNTVMDSYIKTSIEDGKTIILRSKKPKEFRGARFRVSISFENGVLDRICLVAAAKQVNPEYLDDQDVDELHKHWLANNYGKPTKEELYGYIYVFEDAKICSEYDPRSGSSEILYIM